MVSTTSNTKLKLHDTWIKFCIINFSFLLNFFISPWLRFNDFVTNNATTMSYVTYSVIVVKLDISFC